MVGETCYDQWNNGNKFCWSYIGVAYILWGELQITMCCNKELIHKERKIAHQLVFRIYIYTEHRYYYYLLHYFYSLKTKYGRQKLIAFLKSVLKIYIDSMKNPLFWDTDKLQYYYIFIQREWRFVYVIIWE